MSKHEFMKELESLLSNIPLEEREEALRYYDSYFEDAGVEHEDEIIKELGSPGKVAKLIKTELLSISEERDTKGYFTEKGYKVADDGEDRFDVIKSSVSNATNAEHTESSGQTGSNNQYQSQTANRNSNRGLLLILAICTSFIWFPLLIGAFGTGVGILAAIFGILFGFGIAGFAMIVAGAALFIVGLIQLSVPFVGALMMGTGLLVLGIGMLITLAFIVICKSVIPAMIRGFVNLCRRPFRNRRVMA